MPKRWLVVFSGAVFDRYSADPEDVLTRAGEVKGPSEVIEADDLTVHGGALVFRVAHVVVRVLAPGSYLFVRLLPPEASQQSSQDASQEASREASPGP